MSATSFTGYARYYDLFYRDKDYAAEAREMDRLLRSAGAAPGTLLDVGCGTGAHARAFATLGWRVTGVDQSPAMIALARARAQPGETIEFHCAAGAAVQLHRQFDAVVSLFHVVSYHAAPGELADLLANLRRHLRSGGLLLFDFWHGGGVRADPPVVRERTWHDGAAEVVRVARPTHDPAQQRITVDYEVTRRPPAGAAEHCGERHVLRYFFLPEIDHALQQGGFRLREAWDGDGRRPLAPQSWYALVLAEAVA